MKQLRNLLCVILALIVTIRPAQAWSESGHHIIAVLAFDLMTPESQARVIQLLGQHPRFQEDLQPDRPKSIDKEHWIIGRAAYWPEAARDQPKYNRPNWHYHLGASVILGEDVYVHETPGPLPTGATLDTKELYITQAIELCRQTLRGTAPDSDKALAICWLAHLVGDAHQPCNAGSLYAQTVFPAGDRGGHAIRTKQRENLHALWDGLLGMNYDAADVIRRCREIRDDEQTWNAAVADAASSVVDPDKWLREGSELAKSHVYTPEILVAIAAAQRIGTNQVEVIDLPEAYLQSAGTVAQRRAAFAAARLAKILREDLK
jgi:hypothetical protein